jgi:hypothetical protein
MQQWSLARSVLILERFTNHLQAPAVVLNCTAKAVQRVCKQTRTFTGVGGPGAEVCQLTLSICFQPIGPESHSLPTVQPVCAPWTALSKCQHGKEQVGWAVLIKSSKYDCQSVMIQAKPDGCCAVSDAHSAAAAAGSVQHAPWPMSGRAAGQHD